MSFSWSFPRSQDDEDKRPIIAFDKSNVELRGMVRKRLGDWEIKYGEKGSGFTQSFTVSRGTTFGSAAGGFKVYWSD